MVRPYEVVYIFEAALGRRGHRQKLEQYHAGRRR
jgi:hypothetical protein